MEDYLIEGIKPPRLSAKNRDLWKGANEKTIFEWFKKNCSYGGTVTIVNGGIDVDGSVTIADDVEFFPYPFRKVTGVFDCSSCRNLTSLVGSPNTVRDFICYNCNSLTSLEGAPEKVYGYFDCHECEKLESLEGAPEKVGGNFICCDCRELKSLKGAPKEVDGTFDCSDCPNVTSLKGFPKRVTHGVYCLNCGAEFTEEDIESVSNVSGGIEVSNKKNSDTQPAKKPLLKRIFRW